MKEKVPSLRFQKSQQSMNIIFMDASVFLMKWYHWIALTTTENSEKKQR